jgi:hypothetical protein
MEPTNKALALPKPKIYETPPVAQRWYGVFSKHLCYDLWS